MKPSFQDLDDLFDQLRAHNEGKNIFRIVGTPAVFGALAILGYVLALLGGALGVQTMVALGQGAALASLAMLALWVYTR